MMLKVMFDTNVFNRILDGIASLDALAGHAEVFATHIQLDELNRTKNQARRAALGRVFVTVVAEAVPTESLVLDVSRLGQARLGGERLVPTASAVYGSSKSGQSSYLANDDLYSAIKARLDSLNGAKPNNVHDALIAETSIKAGHLLVTDDEDLTVAANEYGAQCVSVGELWARCGTATALILAALPAGTLRVLDVGCGDGMLSAQLVDAGVADVVAVDIDRPVLNRARARHAGRPIEWMHGDVQQLPLEPNSFDAVVCVAALHHMDASRALQRFAQLVRPGGTVVVVGLAAHSWFELPQGVVAAASRVILGLVYGRWKHSAPERWPPPLTYGAMKALSARTLPGVRYRRHLLGRYSLVWEKPQSQ